MFLIDCCVRNNRAVVLLFIFILAFGAHCYNSASRESFPDVSLPMVLVQVDLRGASAIDVDKLLIKPIVKEIATVADIEEISSYAMDGIGHIVAEFSSDVSIDKVVKDVRDKANAIRGSLPLEVRDLKVDEVNMSLFPVLNVILRSDMPYRQLRLIADRLKDEIKGVVGVLDAKVVGNMEEIVDVIISPEVLRGYDVTIAQILNAMSRANSFKSVGEVRQQSGQYSISVDTKLTDLKSIINVPIKGTKDGVLYVRDLVDVRMAYRDPTMLAHVDGQDALAIEVSKKIGTDVMQVTNGVKKLIDSSKTLLPENLDISYSQDASSAVSDSVNNLENSVLFSIIIVLIIIAAFSNFNSAFLVALTIPGSFLIGIISISMLGYTINMMVLFSLMLSVGILVDSSLVVVEYADRLLFMQRDPKTAFIESATKMFMPVVASTLTTQVVFLPLLFWPGVPGQFLKYLPVTVLFVMTGSLVMSLYFVPTLGAIWCRIFNNASPDYIRRVVAIEECRVEHFDKLTASYYRALLVALRHPKKVVLSVVSFSCIAIAVFVLLGRGVEFLPAVEPANILVMVKARGNLSIDEKVHIVREAESRIVGHIDDVRVFYARIGQGNSGGAIEKDIIGQIFLELIPWEYRRSSSAIIGDIKSRLSEVPGVLFEVVKQASGPPKINDVQVLLTTYGDDSLLHEAESKIMKSMQKIGGFVDVKDSLSTGLIKFDVMVDSEKAAILGVDKQSVAETVSLCAGGLYLGKYSGERDDMDIMLHYDREHRNLRSMFGMAASSIYGGYIALSDILSLKGSRADQIERVNGARALRINANVIPGLIVNNQIKALRKDLESNWNRDVTLVFKGEAADMAETRAFLAKAFMVAILGIVLILLLTFNSVYKTLLIMTAILFSVVGVLLGILLAHSAFGIVMCGISIVTLAGIAVNNNILLVDMYDHYNTKGHDRIESIIKASISRFRPILLTSVTTALGLLPMVFRLSLDFIHGNISYNSPPSQFWAQLSSAIAGGMLFSTVIVLFFTPAAIVLIDPIIEKYDSLGEKGLVLHIRHTLRKWLSRLSKFINRQ